MEKDNSKTNNRGLRALIIVALIVAVAGISVAFAALSQTLTINSAGLVMGTEWNIKWTARSGSVVNGGSGVSEGSASSVPAVNLTISGITLELPGDKVEWVITAENLGSIDAELDNITNILNKSVVFDVAEESSLTASDIIVTLTKNPSGAIAAGQDLLSGATQEYLLTIEFNPLAEEIPSHDVTVTITSAFPWVQK